MDKKTTSIVSYLTIIGWLIAFLAGAKEEAKFYLNQSLVLNVCNVVLSLIVQFVSVSAVLYIVWILQIILFVFWIIGLVHAVKQDDKEIPLIGGIRILK